LRTEESTVFVLVFVVNAVLTDSFIGVGNRRRNHIATAGPFAEIDQAAAVTAEWEVGVGGLGRFLADGAAELEGALARHK